MTNKKQNNEQPAPEEIKKDDEDTGKELQEDVIEEDNSQYSSTKQTSNEISLNSNTTDKELKGSKKVEESAVETEDLSKNIHNPKGQYVTKGEPIPKVKEKTSKQSYASKAKVNPGTMLEYRIQRLLFHMGYFSKIGIELKTSQEDDSEVITDLDVYGTYIHKDFRNKTVWADCKSGRAKPLERISWMKGIKGLHEIDDILFVKGGVKSSIKHFARKSDIQVLDLMLIERLEKDFSIKKDDWSGSWNPDVLLNKLNDFSKLTVPSNELYKKIAKFVSSEFWTTDKYTCLKKCITALRELSTIPLEGLTYKDQHTVKWGIYELTSLFVLSLLKIIRELYYFSEHERRNALHDGLVSGEISIKKRTELVSAAYRLAFELVRAQQPDFKPPANLSKMVNINPPNYFEALDDLISRIIHNPNDYYDLIRALDYALLEYDLQDKDWDMEALSKSFHNMENNIKGMKTILHFICQVTRIPKNYYKLLN